MQGPPRAQPRQQYVRRFSQTGVQVILRPQFAHVASPVSDASTIVTFLALPIAAGMCLKTVSHDQVNKRVVEGKQMVNDSGLRVVALPDAGRETRQSRARKAGWGRVASATGSA